MILCPIIRLKKKKTDYEPAIFLYSFIVENPQMNHF